MTKRISRQLMRDKKIDATVAKIKASPMGEDRAHLIEKLVSCFSPLIYKIANNRWRSLSDLVRLPLTIDDLYQEGCMGMCDAIDKYNKDIGVPFSKYCPIRIKGAMNDYIREACSKYYNTSRVTVASAKKIRSAYDAFVSLSSRTPTISELSAIVGMKEKKVEKLLVGALSLIYMDDPNNFDETAFILSTCKNPAEEYEDRETVALVKRLLVCLSEKELKIIYLIYWKGLTQIEVGNHFAVTESRINKIKKVALVKMSACLSDLGEERFLSSGLLIDHRGASTAREICKVEINSALILANIVNNLQAIVS